MADKYKLSKLYFITHLKNFLSNDHADLYVKQALKIIANFHYVNKNILFIIPSSLYSNKNVQIFRNYSHFLFIKELWANGLIGNNKNTLNSLKKKKKIVDCDFSKLDLVVIMDVKDNDIGMVNEFKKLNKPVILFVDKMSQKSNTDLFYSAPYHSCILGMIASIFKK